jgi:hypothetical protein
MSREKRVRIFLGSPGDVPNERKLVRKVLHELNEVVGREKNVFFDLYDSGQAYPTYGSDGQEAINQQLLGDMRNYDIILIIMWNRIGSPTPRDISGTVEEFHRAVAARKRRKKPDIWLFFRTRAPSSKVKIDPTQQKEVAKFKQQIRGKGLFREFQGPAQFEETLRKSLQRWLSAQLRKPVPGKGKTGRQDKGAEERGQPIPATQGSKSTARRTRSTGKTGTVSSTSPAPSKRKPLMIEAPGKWVMLGDHFYQTSSIDVDREHNQIILQIPQISLAQGTELRDLHPSSLHSRRQIPFSSEHHYGNVYVQSADPVSRQGKTTFTVALSLPEALQHNNMFYYVGRSNLSAEEVARLRAARILLGEPLPQDLEGRNSWTFTAGNTSLPFPDINTLPELWRELKTTASAFLPKAWLYVAYRLMLENIVDAIQILKLGPIQQKVLKVKFQGKKYNDRQNRQSDTLSVEGDCPLNAIE